MLQPHPPTLSCTVWCHVEQGLAIFINLCLNCTFVSKINDYCCLKPLGLKVVCYVKIHNHYWQPTRSIITRFPLILLTSVLLHFSHLFSSDFRLSSIPLPQGPYACSYVCLEYFSPIYPHALLPRLLHLSSNMTLSTRTFSVALLFFIAFITNLRITYILLIWINHLSFPVRT